MRTGSVISGSVALAVMTPFQLRDWDPTDLDIYVTVGSADEVLSHLEKVEGYFQVVKGVAVESAYSRLGPIREVVKLVGTGGEKIDLILSNDKSALTPIFRFYGTHVMNAITGRGIFCVYPHRTLAQRVVLNGFGRSTSPRVQKCMVKYTKRGFRFDINAIIMLETPHRCTLSWNCPHTSRHLFDQGILVLATHNAEVPVNFVDNCMIVVFNGSYSTCWVLGGDPCDVEVGGPLTATSFVSEVKLRDE